MNLKNRCPLALNPPHASAMIKSQIQNPKSETMQKIQKNKWDKQTPRPVCPLPLFPHLNLFRISLFGFRIFFSRLLLLVSLLALRVSAAPLTLDVAPNGNDQRPGKLE